MNTQEIQSCAEFLASVELLSALTRVEIERLAQSAESRLLAFGDTVCTAGEVAAGLFIVKSGSIRVFAADGDKERSLGVRKAGEVFGEIAILREYRHEWSARASGKTELLFVPRDVIGPIVAGNPTACAFVASRVVVSSAGGLIGKVLRGSLRPDVESKVFNGAAGDLLGPFASGDRTVFEIFRVNAKHPARLDDDTATEVRRLLREEWLRARAQEHAIEAT